MAHTLMGVPGHPTDSKALHEHRRDIYNQPFTVNPPARRSFAYREHEISRGSCKIFRVFPVQLTPYPPSSFLVAPFCGPLEHVLPPLRHLHLHKPDPRSRRRKKTRGGRGHDAGGTSEVFRQQQWRKHTLCQSRNVAAIGI